MIEETLDYLLKEFTKQLLLIKTNLNNNNNLNDKNIIKQLLLNNNNNNNSMNNNNNNNNNNHSNYSIELIKNLSFYNKMLNIIINIYLLNERSFNNNINNNNNSSNMDNGYGYGSTNGSNKTKNDLWFVGFDYLLSERSESPRASVCVSV